MTFSLKIDCDNAAFEERPASEITRILRELANKIDYGTLFIGDEGKLRDLNGNTVGEWLFA